MAGLDAAPRGFASQAETREATGPRPGGITTALRGARWTRDWLSRESGGLVPGSPARGQKSPRWSAGRRESSIARGLAAARRHPRRGADRRSVPFGLAERGNEKTGSPGPPTTGAMTHAYTKASVLLNRRGSNALSVRSRASGNPGAKNSDFVVALGPRFRGDEREVRRDSSP